jgi:hypothetical protein
MSYPDNSVGFQNPQEIITGKVIIEGTADGLFIYSGTGAAGNPPVLSAVAPGTTTDPFSNMVQALLTIGLLAGAHTQFDDNGNISIVNASGDTVIYISPSLQYIGFYPLGLGNGIPIITIAANNGTDPDGFVYQSGFQVWGSNGTSNIELTDLSGVPSAFFSTGVPEETAGTSAVIEAEVINAGASEQIQWFLTGPRIQVGSGATVARGSTSTLLENSGGGPYSVTWATNPAAGSKVLIWVWTSTSTTVTNAVDNGTSPLTYSFDLVTTNSAGQHLYLLRADGITLPATGAYAVSLTAVGTTSVVASGTSYTGVKTGGPTATNTDTGTSVNVSTNAATPGFAGALASAGFTTDLFVSSSISAAGGGFTNRATQPSGVAFAPGAAADQIVSGGPSAETCSWTVGNSAAWVGAVAVYDAIQPVMGNYTYITMTGEAKDASSDAGGSLIYANLVSGLHDLLNWSAQGIQVNTMIPGDGNTYQVEEIRFVQAANQLINNTSAAQFLTTFDPGAGEYMVEGQILILTTAAAGAPEFQFAGTAVMSSFGVVFTEITEGAPGVMENVGTITALNQNFQGATLNNAGRLYKFEGSFICSATGTLGIFAATTVAADTFTIQKAVTKMIYKPVGST